MERYPFLKLRKSRMKSLKPCVKFAHAIVIGGGMAGLLAACVLLNHFEEVTIIERDHYPQEPVFRPGVPQGRQVHILLLRGQHLLEAFFPGLSQKLLAQGATPQDYANGILYNFGEDAALIWHLSYKDGTALVCLLNGRSTRS